MLNFYTKGDPLSFYKLKVGTLIIPFLINFGDFLLKRQMYIPLTLQKGLKEYSFCELMVNSSVLL